MNYRPDEKSRGLRFFLALRSNHALHGTKWRKDFLREDPFLTDISSDAAANGAPATIDTERMSRQV
jgi:hypothetical protein